jgi:acyl-CoA thioesterase-1
VRGATAAIVALSMAATLTCSAWAQAATGQRPPELPPLAKECGETGGKELPLPNSARALLKTKKLKILAIGASPGAVLGSSREGTPALLEQLLEHMISGLDVEIINRGVSGELAQDAANRLKIEVALNQPDVVLWQVGTNDAFAQVAVEDFQEVVGDMVRWLKGHNVDVILVGLHYVKHLVKDPHYQAMRATLQHIANAENVPRVGRYEATEVLARSLRESGRIDPSEFGSSEASYNCMAQYVARVIAVGLYAKEQSVPKH